MGAQLGAGPSEAGQTQGTEIQKKSSPKGEFFIAGQIAGDSYN